jgi:predicted DCC family thiol-disulfide oxidoreductase YuxK
VSRGALTRWMFEEYRLADESLAVSRVLTALCLLGLVYPRYVWLASFPSSFYAPPLGLGILFRGLPPLWILWAILAAAVTLTLALLVGWHTQVTGLALTAVLLVGNTFEYALGKINHDILLLVVLVTMAFSGWGRRYSVDERRRAGMAPAAAWPLALLALVVGFAMFSAGLPKAMAGWLDPRTQSAQYHLLVNYHVLERPTLAGRLALDHLPTAGWEVLDWATVGLELALLPAAFSRRAMLAVCGLAVLFHAVIHVTMEISFWTNLLAYAMFVDWAAVLSRSRLEGVSSGLTVLSRARGSGILAAGIVATVLYGAVADPMLSRSRTAVDIDWIRFSLAMLAAGGFVAFAAGRTIVERRSAHAGESTMGLDRQPLVLFDGVCGMCNRTVDFVLAHDRDAVFRFAALQSAAGQAALARHRLPPDYSDSMVLIVGGRCHRYSTAVLEIARRLGLPWAMLWALTVVPPPLRDVVYDFVAARRYRWFGKLDACRVPTAAERARFVS